MNAEIDAQSCHSSLDRIIFERKFWVLQVENLTLVDSVESAFRSPNENHSPLRALRLNMALSSASRALIACRDFCLRASAAFIEAILRS
jgi:hypothetical protein